tara:strand:+ start:3021 stop:3332 length:312 start_codon:yes stop_codon:yes gene_type:complete
MNNHPTCETCIFKQWDGCRYNPPVERMDDYGNYTNKFPEVMNEDWCGQHVLIVNVLSEDIPSVAVETDDVIHSSNFDKVYNKGHSYVTYHGHVMHDPDCICLK